MYLACIRVLVPVETTNEFATQLDDTERCIAVFIVSVRAEIFTLGLGRSSLSSILHVALKILVLESRAAARNWKERVTRLDALVDYPRLPRRC